MKTMKKLASAALALVMALCLTVPAFATEEKKGSITVTNPQMNETYTLYKILDLAYGGSGVEDESDQGTTPSNEPHTYTINANWTDFINQDTINGIYVDVDDQGYVTWHENADAAAFAKLAVQWATDHSVPSIGTIIPTEEAPAVKFENLDLGYYLIDSTLGALCALDSTNLNANVREKNLLPTMTKTIESTTNGTVAEDGKSGTASYGDTVTFVLTVNIPATAVGEMIVHDTMDSRLTYGGMIAPAYTEEVPENERVTAATAGFTDSCTMEFTIPENVVADNLGSPLLIKYTAAVNANVDIESAMTNTAHLTYSKYNTPDDTVEIRIFAFGLNKVNSAGETLTGAQFELYQGDTKISLVKELDGNYRVYVTDETLAAGEAAEGEEAPMETVVDYIEAGSVTIKGLSDGIYALRETVAPEGYNRLKEDVAVKIEGGKAYVKNAAYDPANEESLEWLETAPVSITNYTGAELPETGGIGTTIFYIVGGLLAVGAGVLLVTKKKMGADEE